MRRAEWGHLAKECDTRVAAPFEMKQHEDGLRAKDAVVLRDAHSIDRQLQNRSSHTILANQPAGKILDWRALGAACRSHFARKALNRPIGHASCTLQIQNAAENGVSGRVHQWNFRRAGAWKLQQLLARRRDGAHLLHGHHCGFSTFMYRS